MVDSGGGRDTIYYPPSTIYVFVFSPFASIATRLALFAADLAAAPWLAHACLLSVRVLRSQTVRYRLIFSSSSSRRAR